VTGELLPVASGRRSGAVVLGLVRGHRGLLAAAVGCLVGAAAASLLTAPLLGSVVDLALEGDVEAITARALLLLAAALLQAALAFAGLAAVARLGERVLAGMRESFVESALALPLERVERGGSGDLTSRVTEDVAMVSDAVRLSVPEFLQAALVIALTVVGLAALDWRFGAAALLAVPIQALTARWYVRRSGPLYAERRAAAGGEQQQLLETIGGAATVRAFGLADEHLGRIRGRIDRSVDLTLAVTHLQTRFFGKLNLAEYVGLAAVLAAGFLLVRGGVVSVGVATAAALYFANLFGPINTVLFLLDTVQSATASVARLVGVMDLADPAPAGGSAAHDGSVETTGLGHSYLPGHPVLHDVELEIPAGSTVALVGTTGGGKSTLAALLAGVRAPTTGTVRIGGRTPDELGPEQLRRAVVLVTQEVHVFAGTLAGDLRLAAPDADDARLLSALDAVGAAEWARNLPDGLATEVGEGGHDLGPEQVQQLALARILLADPLVAILDEATAEAGSSGARALDAAAATVLRERTGILVAHRLTQAAEADVILVMEAGRVVERGSHPELLAAAGRYAALWHAWSAERPAPPPS
jgi:ATP-binding cassette, subfamily C, bacterial